MSSADDSDEHGGGDSVRAAEFVLGLLPPEDHTLFSRSLAEDPALRAEVALWRGRLSALDHEFADVAPPSQGWSRLEARLFPPSRAAHRASWWDSLALWRGLAGASAAVAILAIGFNLLRPAPLAPEEFATQLVAALQAQEGSGVEFVALYDTASGTVRLLGVSGDEVPGKDYELWYIRGQDPAVSMGVVPVAGRVAMPLDERARAALSEGTVLAVTLEQEGGSPTGVAQGPIVAVGTATPI